MRYINFCSNSGAVQTALDEQELGKPYVVYIEDEKRLDWNSKSRVIPFSEQPLTFEIISGGTIVFSSYNNSSTCVVEYKKNNSDWAEVHTSRDGTAISVSPGDIIQIKGKDFTSNYNGPLKFEKSTATFSAYGNIMSLLSGTGFENITVLTGDYAYSNLFDGCSGLTDAGNLILPATTLTNHAYDKMFRNCVALTTPPELPATSLIGFCYQEMFYGCASLSKAPDLLANYVPTYGYYYMFYGCRNLNYVKCLATEFENNYTTTRNMLSNVSPTGTFVKHPNATWSTGSDGIPSGWTIIDAEI